MDSLQLLDPQRRLPYDDGVFDDLTHYIFRFPAKFHPPVVKALIDKYSQHGDSVLDPFCGSGTMLVEAAVAGRHAAGSDIDPVAAFVSRVKTRRYHTTRLATSWAMLTEKLAVIRRPNQEYVDRRFQDMTESELTATIGAQDLWVPAIPNLFHWFRKYVIRDLARIHNTIRQLSVPKTHKDFFFLCFAAIIRAASNADPVPVSGLEVTSYMKRKDQAGRIVNPFVLFDKAVKNAFRGVVSYQEKTDKTTTITITQTSALNLATRFRRSFDAVITSPPYHSAVDYYRRHQLEMFWLGFTKTQADRLALMAEYLGRAKIAQSLVPTRGGGQLGGLANEWEDKLERGSTERARAFRHYAVSMRRVFCQLARILKDEGRAVFVVGHSMWNGAEIPTVELFAELAGPTFFVDDYAWYPVKNRYMSYRRHNGASIDKEHVLVMRKAKGENRR